MMQRIGQKAASHKKAQKAQKEKSKGKSKN
jgi:hypothetical protein